jgi:hypothetical protein
MKAGRGLPPALLTYCLSFQSSATALSKAAQAAIKGGRSWISRRARRNRLNWFTKIAPCVKRNCCWLRLSRAWDSGLYLEANSRVQRAAETFKAAGAVLRKTGLYRCASRKVQQVTILILPLLRIPFPERVSEMGQDFRVGDWVHAVGFDGVLEVVEVNERPRLARLRHPLHRWVTPLISWDYLTSASQDNGLGLGLAIPAVLSQALVAQYSSQSEMSDLYVYLIRSRLTLAEALCVIAEQQIELRQEESAGNTLAFLRRIVEDLRQSDSAGVPDFAERLSRLEDRADKIRPPRRHSGC